MGIKAILVLLVGLTLPSVHLAEAQQQAQVPKIGWVGARPAPRNTVSTSGRELFRRELRKLGYIEGKNIAFEYRSAENKLDRLPALADELVRLNVDVLVTGSTAATLAAQNATRAIPIVFLSGSDPVALGLVDTLARPGGTSRGSPALGRCWLANDWSYSRKPFPSSPALRCCGIHRIQPLRNHGKKANCRHENWVCNFIPWR